ncbi:MAG: hypothetical protein LKE38_02675 [Leuconostoc mesenteroides]|jgi:ABC-2 type transport system permease protein|nr:hypothetical protein [Leuconostoc mesenteroides]
MIKKRKLVFEFQNLLGNIITLFFGFAFAPMMALVFGNSYANVPQALNQLYLGFFCTIPLSMVFVGFSSLFSQEVEQGFTLRAELFGLFARFTSLTQIYGTNSVCSIIKHHLLVDFSITF